MSVASSIDRLMSFALVAAAFIFVAGGAGAEGVLRIGTNVSTVTFDPIRTHANADIIEAIDTELTKLAEAHEKLETLNHYFPE